MFWKSKEPKTDVQSEAIKLALNVQKRTTIRLEQAAADLSQRLLDDKVRQSNGK